MKYISSAANLPIKVQRAMLTFLLTASILITYTLFGWILNTSNESAPDPRTQVKNFWATHLPMPKKFRGKKLPFHQVYESRKVGPYHRQYNGNYNKDVKMVLLWTAWNFVHKTINYYCLRPGVKSFKNSRCPVFNCLVVKNRNLLMKADAVIFHLLDFTIQDVPKYRRPDQVWILYNMEPPWIVKRHIPNLDSLDGLFNLSMSYRDDSDITVKYGVIEKGKDFQPIDFDTIWLKKTRSAIWFTSDCNTDSRREKYVEMLRKYIDIDIYGLCGEKKCFPSQSTACFEKLLLSYKFYLSFENAICEDYVTEKFFNVFNYDIIPVVFGGADYSQLAPPGSYLVANEFPKPEDLALEMTRIGSNANLYSSYLRRKLSHKAFLDPWPCRLCEKLHIPSKPSKLNDVKKWWISNAKCQRWNNSNENFQYEN